MKEPDTYLTHPEAKAVRFIERDRSKPFLLYVPFTAPHSLMQAPETTIEKCASLPRTDYRRTYAMADEMDQAIGRILDTLDEEGIADDTIVLFFSDNGGLNIFGGDVALRGQKGRPSKGDPRPSRPRWPSRLEAGSVADQRLVTDDADLARAASVAPDDRRSRREHGPRCTETRRCPGGAPRIVSEIPIPGLIHTDLRRRWKLVQVIQNDRDAGAELPLRHRGRPERDEHPRALRCGAPADAAPDDRLASSTRSAERRDFVAHPGWVAPRDWAEAVLLPSLLQEDWTNELPFEELDATEHRGMLTDEMTKRRLIAQSEAMRKQQAEAAEATEETR